MTRFLTVLAISAFALAGGALAQGVDCPDLTALQRWAGYLSWLGFFKGLGAVVFAAGFLFFTKGFIFDLLYNMRVLVEAFMYIASVVLIAGGYWVSPEYLTWTVLVGCILFMGSVFASIFIHELEGGNPQTLPSLFTIVWGAVAIYYNMPEVGILTMMALVTLLGFSVAVGQLSYSFGFEDEAAIPRATTAASIILVAYVAQRYLFPDAPAAVQVFSQGAFWVGSLVAFTGLLIMSSKYYSDPARAHYWVMQAVTIAACLGGVAEGMILGINPLAGMAGTFLVLYMAAKPLEVPQKSVMGLGCALMVSGGIMFGMWWLATNNLDLVKPYITMGL